MNIDHLRSRLAYDPTTGIFTWKDGRCAGQRAGHLMNNGYRQISVNCQQHYEHYLAWLFVHGGKANCEEMDHINRVKDDNRIANLRPATRSQNKANMKRQDRGTSGFKGATRVSKRWRAQIHTKDGGRGHIGYFDTPQEANQAYLKAAKELFGEFANDGAAHE